jgi:hypothetical protein
MRSVNARRSPAPCFSFALPQFHYLIRRKSCKLPANYFKDKAAAKAKTTAGTAKTAGNKLSKTAAGTNPLKGKTKTSKTLTAKTRKVNLPETSRSSAELTVYFKLPTSKTSRTSAKSKALKKGPTSGKLGKGISASGKKAASKKGPTSGKPSKGISASGKKAALKKGQTSVKPSKGISASSKKTASNKGTTSGKPGKGISSSSNKAALKAPTSGKTSVATDSALKKAPVTRKSGKV